MIASLFCLHRISVDPWALSFLVSVRCVKKSWSSFLRWAMVLCPWISSFFYAAGRGILPQTCCILTADNYLSLLVDKIQLFLPNSENKICTISLIAIGYGRRIWTPLRTFPCGSLSPIFLACLMSHWMKVCSLSEDPSLLAFFVFWNWGPEKMHFSSCNCL